MRNARNRIGALAGALMLMGGCAPAVRDAGLPLAPGPATAEAVDEGRALVRARCASCHAVSPAGGSPMAEAPPLRDLHRRYPVAYLQEALAEGLMTAHPAMPEVELAPGQIAALIAYLESLEAR